MARRAWDISDEFWAAVEPLLPARERRFRYPGRKPIEDRAVLQGIIFVLVTGIPWKALPIELGFGSGQTCHRRPDRPATPQATAAVRRSWLRLPDPPPPTDITRHPAQHRPTWPPARLRPPRDPLRRRAQLRLAAPPPSPRHLLRTPPRHPRRTLRHRLHPHLLATPRTLI